MNIFKKKNPVKKLDVKFEERPEQKININIKPLVKIDLHESRVNGKPNKPEYVISIAERDNIILSEREYNELFSEMLADMDDTKLIHLIAEAHMLKHKKIEEAHEFMGGLSKFLEENGGDIFGKIFNR